MGHGPTRGPAVHMLLIFILAQVKGHRKLQRLVVTDQTKDEELAFTSCT